MGFQRGTRGVELVGGVRVPVGELDIGGTKMTATAAELNKMDGMTASKAELNTLDGITATVAELNTLDGITATKDELNQAADLSAQGALVRVKKLSITSAPDGTEQDTGWDLPAKSIVLDVFVDVTTAEATGTVKTLDVGLKAGESGGDTDGFLSSISVAATGIQKGKATYTDGTNQNYVSANTIGALLFEGLVGGDVAGTAGVINKTPHVVNGTAVSVVYDADDVDWVEFRGDIYVVYVEIG